jgi:23S rRNA pseudouridine955/2504/2580 synthase
VLEFQVTEDHANVRLDKFLKKKLANVPFSHLFKMIRVKKIKVNAKRAHPETMLQAGDVVTVRGDEKQLTGAHEKVPLAATKDDLAKLSILFEDDYIMVIDKPSGMAVHTGSGITGGTVVDVVRAHLGDKAVRNDFAASPAHRIDRETSGVLVVAKRRPAMVHFTDVFTHHKAKKRYLALVKGKVVKLKGLIDTPLAEHQQTKASKDKRGTNMQEAMTRYEVLAQNDAVTFLSCTIETGRTHQIRRHFLSIGHPVVGDAKHGDFAFNREAQSSWGLKRLFLHAQRLEFPHPEGSRRVKVEAPLPEALLEALKRMGLAATF